MSRKGAEYRETVKFCNKATEEAKNSKGTRELPPSPLGTLIFAQFLFKFFNNGNIQKLNAWSFELLNNDFCILNIERVAALHVHDITCTDTCTDTNCKFRKRAAQKTDGVGLRLLWYARVIGQGFHLQGNFPAKGNFGLCREKSKEIKFTKKYNGKEI